jgi:hypothetical protein
MGKILGYIALLGIIVLTVKEINKVKADKTPQIKK